MMISLLLMACNGKLVWVSNQDEPNKIVNPIKTELKPDINGVVLTFDDGPSLANTPKILDILKQHNLRATFFVEGINLVGESEMAKERRELLKRISQDGHIIANHSFDHKNWCSMTSQGMANDIDRTSNLIKSISGQEVRFVRPPYGKKCKALTEVLKKRDLTAIYWQIDVREYERSPLTHQQKTKEEVLKSFVDQYAALKTQGLHKMVLILHDTKSITAESLPLILDYLSK